MEKIDNEYYVSSEVAKLLKEAGFDWECRKIYYCYHEDGDKWELEDNHKNHQRILELDYCLLAPTLDVAQRWLREVKNIDINILAESISSHKQYLVSIWFSISSNSSYDNIILDNRYTTYEKSQEAGIQKCLTILLEEKK